MKLVGIGNDIIEVSRIEKAVQKERFQKRVFTENEIAVMEARKTKYEGYAGRFAGKEAVAKALGTGVSGFGWNDIEILNDRRGKPYVLLHGPIPELYPGIRIEVTISHLKEYAVATAVAWME
ncbi:MAG: holo-ACP synthase [Fusobacteriaceae bacterium]|jgi:holo-[acyl-carrier protein] synthase|nr:holo-ACP synthase [Fusobacteriaceae bacterium]